MNVALVKMFKEQGINIFPAQTGREFPYITEFSSVRPESSKIQIIKNCKIK